MLVTQAERDGWAVVTVAGDMDLLRPRRSASRCIDAVADGRRDVVLDLAEVRFCDSSGVGVLIGARRLMRSCAGRLRIVLPEDPAPGADGGPRQPGAGRARRAPALRGLPRPGGRHRRLRPAALRLNPRRPPSGPLPPRARCSTRAGRGCGPTRTTRTPPLRCAEHCTTRERALRATPPRRRPATPPSCPILATWNAASGPPRTTCLRTMSR